MTDPPMVQGEKRILVVDDDPDMRKALSVLLEKHYPVIEAVDGREALEVIKRDRPALVLLDVSMPGMSGIETLEAARGLQVKPAFIMLTSDGDIELAKRALDLGAVEYITKPFSSDYLLDEVRRLIQPSRRQPYTPWRLAVDEDTP